LPESSHSTQTAVRDAVAPNAVQAVRVPIAKAARILVALLADIAAILASEDIVGAANADAVETLAAPLIVAIIVNRAGGGSIIGISTFGVVVGHISWTSTVTIAESSHMIPALVDRRTCPRIVVVQWIDALEVDGIPVRPAGTLAVVAASIIVIGGTLEVRDTGQESVVSFDTTRVVPCEARLTFTGCLTLPIHLVHALGVARTCHRPIVAVRRCTA
jgi:hypothetical protein